MRDDRSKASPAWKILCLGLSAILVSAAMACESDFFDEDIYKEPPPVREPCYEEETWRCSEKQVLELCRNSFWNPWENCAWNGGTCEASDETSEGTAHFGIGACVDPPKQAIACELVNIWDTSDPDKNTSTETDTGTDTGTDTNSDTDTGPWQTYIPQPCSVCLTIPASPEEFYYDGSWDTDTSDTETEVDTDTVEEPIDTDPHDTDHPIMPGGASNGTLGCCSVVDGNAYWGEDEIVQQTCAKGCCAYIDFTSTKKDPKPVQHRCCE